MPSSSPNTPAPPPPAPPEIVGPYKIDQHIGHGGSAEVYAAHDLHTGLPVALKLQSIAGKESETTRFLREYQILSGFCHPHLPSVYALGELPDGRFYLAMERIEGHTTRHYFKHLHPPTASARVEAVLLIAAQIAHTLAALHAQNIIHGDLKPSNIRVHQGHAWLLDLGGARDLEAQTPWIAPKHFFGTYVYAAPEQLQGSADTRSDLYSLGVMLYDLLSGQRPFFADTRAAAIEERATVTPPPLAAHIETIPHALSDLVTQLLARDPEQRPASAAAVSDALAALLHSPPPNRTRLTCANITQAQQRLQSPTQTQPKQPSPWPAVLALGRAQLAAGDAETAASNLSLALSLHTDLDPSRFQLIDALSQSLRLTGRLSEARQLLREAQALANSPSSAALLLISLAEIDTTFDRLALALRWLEGVQPHVFLQDLSLLDRALIVRARIALAFRANLPNEAAALMDAVLRAKARGDVEAAARLLGWCAAVRAVLGLSSAQEMADEAVEALRQCQNLPLLAEASTARVRALNALGLRQPLPADVTQWFSSQPIPLPRLEYYLAVAERDPSELKVHLFAYQQLQTLWPFLFKDDRWAFKLIPWVARCEAHLQAHSTLPLASR